MINERVVILGAGGHAKVIIELISSGGKSAIVGLTDIDRTPRMILGVPVIGDDTILPRLFAEGVRLAFVAIGDNRARFAAGQRVRGLGFALVNAISPRANVSASVSLGSGLAIMAGATINASTIVEDLVIINTGAIVDHDVYLSAGCHVAPGAVVTGGVRIGARAFLGAGSSVVPGLTIGEDAVVGAGACVVRNLGAHTVAVGVPARAIHSISKGAS